MSGIIFLKTKNIDEIKDFYTSEIGMKIWLEQKDILLLKHGNLILGMHQTDDIDKSGLITFFYNTKEEVDKMYEKLKNVADTKPKINEQYNIYNFFAKDPESRKLEFQTFLHPLNPYLDGEEALITRRSIRKYKNEKIPENVLWKIFEICRYSPTSKNCQSYYFIVVNNREKIEYLASLRGSNSAPIAKAPIAVAVCVDTSKTNRPEQDGSISAYHFIISAWLNGLGTCWIAGMDTTEVKQCLGIPLEHYVATVTPLGYPDEFKDIPKRRESREFVNFI